MRSPCRLLAGNCKLQDVVGYLVVVAVKDTKIRPTAYLFPSKMDPKVYFSLFKTKNGSPGHFTAVQYADVEP